MFAFIGGVTHQELESVIKNTYGFRPYFSSDSLQNDIIRGLKELSGEECIIYNLLFYPEIKKVFFSRKMKSTHQNSLIIDVPFLYAKLVQHFSKAFHLERELKHLPKDINQIIVYSAYFPFLKAIYRIKKRRELKVCLVVPDLPEYTDLSSSQSLYSTLSKKICRRLFFKYNRCVDAYVLLTEQMNTMINFENRPHVVVEGIAPSDYNYSCPKEIKNQIVYSGNLQNKYGVKFLLDAVKLVRNNVTFIFYGTGEAKEDIENASKNDKRIVYGGVINREDLHLIQQESIALINPRQDVDDFTKYSFPSKTLEYMLSGRPIIAYYLPGMPEEYKELMYIPEDNSIEGLAHTIDQVLDLDEMARVEWGDKARKFVSTKKCYLEQCRKIYEMVYPQDDSAK